MDALVERKTVLAIGPGISRHPETSEFVRGVVRKYKIPIVLDADGLNAFEGRAAELKDVAGALVITPHPGEMARLIGSTIPAVQHDRINVARTFASEHQLIVVLKGHRTLIAQPDGTVWVNTTGNPGMATGGTGDILTGMVAGFDRAESRPRRRRGDSCGPSSWPGRRCGARAWVSNRWLRLICSRRCLRLFAGRGMRRSEGRPLVPPWSKITVLRSWFRLPAR